VYANLEAYNINPDKLSVVTPFFNAYIEAEDVAADPGTATAGARRTRDDLM
jgi:hypothetical protein